MSYASMDTPILAICPLDEADGNATAELYTRVFLNDEPTTRLIAPDPARFLPLACCYVRWLHRKGLSFCAKDARTGECLGFIFCFDFLDDPTRENPVLQEYLLQFRHAVMMIDALEARHICRDTVMSGSMLHIFQIGVDRKGRRLGIARALVNRVLTHAHERGFSHLVADCTSRASRQLFAECGFFEAGFLSYRSFSIDGTCIFAGLEEGISLMIREFSTGSPVHRC